MYNYNIIMYITGMHYFFYLINMISSNLNVVCYIDDYLWYVHVCMYNILHSYEVAFSLGINFLLFVNIKETTIWIKFFAQLKVMVVKQKPFYN